ncbi:hypothetical protein NKG05_04715 [Oerskovia sp. M15]
MSTFRVKPQPPIVIRHVASSARWDTWTRAERIFCLKACAEADVEALLAAVDAERRLPETA